MDSVSIRKLKFPQRMTLQAMSKQNKSNFNLFLNCSHISFRYDIYQRLEISIKSKQTKSPYWPYPKIFCRVTTNKQTNSHLFVPTVWPSFAPSLNHAVCMLLTKSNSNPGVLNYISWRAIGPRAKESSKTQCPEPNKHYFPIYFYVFWNWARANFKGWWVWFGLQAADPDVDVM